MLNKEALGMFQSQFKKGILVNVIFGVLLISGIALAHPPSAINATYNQDSKILTVKVLHSISNPTGDHIIKEVKVKLNGRDMIIQNFLSQASTNEQDTQYLLIDAKSGDTIEVYALCSKFGDKTITLKVE